MVKFLFEEENKELFSLWVKDILMAGWRSFKSSRGTILWRVTNASSSLTGSEVVVGGGYASFQLPVRLLP